MDEVLHIVIRGRVQGVGFRYHTEAEALRLGIAGWVRNLPSGEVEVLARVPPQHRSAFMEALQTGPAGARVEGMRVGPPPRGYECPARDFTVRY